MKNVNNLNPIVSVEKLEDEIFKNLKTSYESTLQLKTSFNVTLNYESSIIKNTTKAVSSFKYNFIDKYGIVLECNLNNYSKIKKEWSHSATH